MFDCFSSNSDQSTPQIAGGGVNASIGQPNHSQNKRFSVGGDRWSTSLCCSIPAKLANILRFCFCCYCRCSYCDDDGSHHSKSHQRHKNGCSNRQSSFSRDRRLSFPEINVTSAQVIGNSNVLDQQQHPELLPSTSQELPQATIRKEIGEERKSVPGNQSDVSNKTENNSNNKLDYHQDGHRSNYLNIINQLLFDLFKRKKIVNNVPVHLCETDPPSAHNNHPKPLSSPLMQLSASTLSSSISNAAANNDNYIDCDLIQQNNKTFELLESKKSLNEEFLNLYHHPHPQYYHNNVMMPSGSSDSGNNSNVLLSSPSSSKNVTPTRSSFSPALNVGRAFKLKKTIAPQSTSTSTMVMNEQQHKLRMDVSSKRLMKEIGDLMRRQQNKQLTTNFSVELIDDSLYEWNIKIYEFDKESQIYMDMQQYQIPYVQLHAMFPETYPFDPPFIRVVAPYIERGYVMEGGAICLELLTKTGWTSAYTMESVIIQLMASFVKGQAIIKATKDVSKCFTKKSAVNSFRHIVRIHDKHGWVDTPLYEG